METRLELKHTPDLRLTSRLWGWIWVMSSGLGFSFELLPFLRLVTGLFLRIFSLPWGFSIMDTTHPLLFKDSSSSQRADVGSPCFRNAWKAGIVSKLSNMLLSKLNKESLNQLINWSVILLYLHFAAHYSKSQFQTLISNNSYEHLKQTSKSEMIYNFYTLIIFQKKSKAFRCKKYTLWWRSYNTHPISWLLLNFPCCPKDT